MSRRRAPLQWALAAAAAVAAVAVALRLVGVADDVEFLATLLVAPVIAATLLGDRNLGYVTAAVAAVAYLSLRFDDVQEAGALGVMVLVAFRAGSYGFVAYVTPLLSGRLTGEGDLAGEPARHLRVEVVDPWAADEPAAVPPPLPDDELVPPPTPVPATMAAGPADSEFARAWQEEAPLDDWSAEPEPLPPLSSMSASMPSMSPPEPQGPPAPRVPTGWIDDATSPLGDETIPVGFTGELFLGRLTTGSTPVVHPNGASNGNGGRPGLYGATSNGGHHGVEPLAPLRPSVPHVPTYEPPPVEPLRHRQDAAWGAAPPVEPEEPPPPRRHERPPSRPPGAHDTSAGIDPETRLWNAHFFRGRLTSAVEHSRRTANSFSVVMVQVADEPFQPLPYRRQVALLRELGHQFVPRFVDHLVHLPDGAQHWFAVVLDDTDRTGAHAFERRLRSTLAGYLRSRGLRVGEVQSASLTSPDDDEAMAAIWASLLGADTPGVGA